MNDRQNKGQYPNVIFIVLDTLRKDYAKTLEKKLEKFGFISYENAIAPASWTTPSHASMFTGLYPLYHGAHETKNKKGFDVKLTKNDSLLSIQLSDMGYSTYLLTANPHITPTFGFTGFDTVYMPPYTSPILFSQNEMEKVLNISRKYNTKTKLDIVKAFVKENQKILLLELGLKYLLNQQYLYLYSFLKKWPKDKGARYIIKKLQDLPFHEKKPNFIFMNLIEPHEPYSIRNYLNTFGNLTGKTDQKVIDLYRRKYPEAVSYVTKRVVEMIKVFIKAGLFDNSLIIITSDHGQLLGEDGRIGHGTFLYDELLRVPLLIKYPELTKIKLMNGDRYNEYYISLTNLKPFIVQLVKGTLKDDKILYSNTVFSESFGIHDRLAFSKLENYKYFNKYRIAVYYKAFKGIFNVEEWKFESIITYNENGKITNDIKKILKDKLIKYLRNSIMTKITKK